MHSINLALILQRTPYLLSALCLLGAFLPSLVVANSAAQTHYRTELPDPLSDVGWELMLDRQGIKIYTQDWPGSDFVALKARQTIASSLANIVGNYAAIELFPEWVKDMEEARIITPFNDALQRKIYMRVGLPWPLQDRDTVSGQGFSQDPDTKVVTVREWFEGNTIPKIEGVVRMPRLNTEFILIPKSESQTLMIYQGHNDPGGFIPSFLVNWMIEDIFFDSMKNMQQRFEAPEHGRPASWVKNY